MNLIARRNTATAFAWGLILFMSHLLSFHRSAQAATEYIPVFNANFSVGQWYFEGDQSSLGGNAGITFVPAVRFTNRFSLIPSVDSSYRGTRSAEELAGGSTLFEDTWESGVGLKSIHGLSNKWRLKNRMGARMKWYRETTDETWSNGLYDYQTITFGTELERILTKRSAFSVGYDFSYLQFPNYESLESSQSSDNSREFAGGAVLDNRIHLVSLKLTAALPGRVNSTTQLFVSPRYFVAQNIVVASGLLTDTKRKDLYTGGTIGFDRLFQATPKLNVLSNFYFGYSALDSNQNHYDATQTVFIEDFYDYGQTRLGTQFSFLVGMQNNLAMSFNVGGSYSRRQYQNRVIQNEDASYGSEKLNTTETFLDFSYVYPLSKNFRLKVSSTFGQSKSNNDYEAVYRYNYTNSNYQFGFTYDY